MKGKERKYDTKLRSIFLNFNQMYTPAIVFPSIKK